MSRNTYAGSLVSTGAARIAEIAACYVGTPFRLSGRGHRGLDCVGLIMAVLDDAGFTGPDVRGYRLRNLEIDRWIGLAEARGLRPIADPSSTPSQVGDIILARPSAAQWHLLFADTAVSFIHADARLRKVVRSPTPLPWPVIAAWRAPDTSES